jgi:ABC-type transport system involved in multi-copper enzyme maturation permease subunit
MTTPTTPTVAPYRSEMRAGHDGFAQLVRAEWTKFRSVRGWVIGLVVAGLLILAVGVLTAASSHRSCNGSACSAGSVGPVGPDGSPVVDLPYLVHQSLTGDGSITARVTSLTGHIPNVTAIQSNQGPQMVSGVEDWSKVGVIIKQNTNQGSAYAAMMVTGSHGVRMQYDYTHDTAGSATGVTSSSPVWLRLTRAGDTITGYESADGVTWTKVGTADLAGLPSTVQIGLFAASPDFNDITSQHFGGTSAIGGPTDATGAFDHVNLAGTAAGGTWSGDYLGGNGSGNGGGGVNQPAWSREPGGTFSVTGSGDVAPVIAGDSGNEGGIDTIERGLAGVFMGLIVIVVLAAMFMTAEYRRGLIRTTLAASPRRGRVLAAKAVVIGAVGFVAGLIAVAITVPLVEHLERANGFSVMPVSGMTEARVMIGTAALLAVAAVLAVAVGTVLRRSAAAVTTLIVVIVLPYLLAVLSALPAGPADWMLRLTPAAAFAVQQTVVQYAQVDSQYTPASGYFPLTPWTGFAVLCAYALAGLGLAVYLLRRRDA